MKINMIAYHAIVFLFIAVVDAQDFELFLSPTGDDFANGTLSDPILSLQEALNRAPAGERVTFTLLPGLYDEQIVTQFCFRLLKIRAFDPTQSTTIESSSFQLACNCWLFHTRTSEYGALSWVDIDIRGIASGSLANIRTTYCNLTMESAVVSNFRFPGVRRAMIEHGIDDTAGTAGPLVLHNVHFNNITSAASPSVSLAVVLIGSDSGPAPPFERQVGVNADPPLFGVNLTGCTFDYSRAVQSVVQIASPRFSSVLLRGCTFHRNLAGAILFSPASVTSAPNFTPFLLIDDCTFNRNAVSLDQQRPYSPQNLNGGAAAYVSRVKDISITRSTFTNNAAVFGGALAVVHSPLLSIADSQFTANAARHLTAILHPAPLGGAVFLQNVSAAVIQRSTFTRNRAQLSGGAVSAVHTGLALTTVQFNNCTAAVNAGALLFLLNSSSIAFLDVDKNTQMSSGHFLADTDADRSVSPIEGQEQFVPVPSLLLSGVTARYCTARRGGALFLDLTLQRAVSPSQWSPFLIVDSTFRHCTGSDYGGAVYFAANAHARPVSLTHVQSTQAPTSSLSADGTVLSLVISRSNFSHNFSPTGGAFYYKATPTGPASHFARSIDVPLLTVLSNATVWASNRGVFGGAVHTVDGNIVFVASAFRENIVDLGFLPPKWDNSDSAALVSAASGQSFVSRLSSQLSRLWSASTGKTQSTAAVTDINAATVPSERSHPNLRLRETEAAGPAVLCANSVLALRDTALSNNHVLDEGSPVMDDAQLQVSCADGCEYSAAGNGANSRDQCVDNGGPATLIVIVGILGAMFVLILAVAIYGLWCFKPRREKQRARDRAGSTMNEEFLPAPSLDDDTTYDVEDDTADGSYAERDAAVRAYHSVSISSQQSSTGSQYSSRHPDYGTAAISVSRTHVQQ